jgi:hypothetical protein
MFLCKCVAWSATFRERRRLKGFENVALRKKFGPKGEEVTGGGRKFYSEEVRGKWYYHAYCGDEMEVGEMGRLYSTYG